LKILKNILARYTHWVQGVLAPLGAWGVFTIAAVDGSFMGLPLDLVFIGYVYNNRPRFLLYVLMASAGSALGSSVLYLIGYLGGETLLRKRMPEQRFATIHASFDRHEFWALMFPAMLPPPTPFKLFVLAAAVFEMRFTHFLAAIFAGRFVRFLIEALLTIWFGPQFVHFVGDLVRAHASWVMAGLALLVAFGFVVWWRKKSAGSEATQAEGRESVR
jgi:membrane protein YqaA with SNARE-associated domain